MSNILTTLQYVNWNASPYIFQWGNFGLRWYGVLFIAGFLLGYCLFINFFKREHLPQKLLDPMLYMLLICALIGARLGHCFFYEPDYYLAHPGEILKVWHGGLASHGGTIAILFGVWWYVHRYGKKYGFDYLYIVDRLALAVPFAGMLIRLGNLMNSEIYGHVTSLPWGFIFLRNGETLPCHPTQLYEALSYLLIGILLMVIYYKVSRKEIDDIAQKREHTGHGVYKGFFIGMFMLLVFTARFLIEFVKNPQVQNEVGRPLNNGQLLSIPFILLGIALVIWSYYAKKPVVRNFNTKEIKKGGSI